MEEGLITREEARKAGLEEIWTIVMRTRASTTETQRLLGIAELKSEIDENLDKVNVCLREFRKDDSSKD